MCEEQSGRSERRIGFRIYARDCGVCIYNIYYNICIRTHTLYTHIIYSLPSKGDILKSFRSKNLQNV